MIGVCLKYTQRNYGSQLQARATIKMLEELGLICEIIVYKKRGLWYKLKCIPRLFNPLVIDGIIVNFNKKKSLHKIEGVSLRNRLFDDYSESHFGKLTRICNYYSDLRKAALSYTAVITCSDQLWNPAGLGANFYNLMFVPDNIRKVSWASSFGVGKIPWYQRKQTRRFLQRIDFISMRENQGAAIVKELTGRIVPVLMDPVFVYTKEEWEKIVPIESVYSFPYVLCYFLGENVEYRKRAMEFAKSNNLRIVSINYVDSYVEYDSSYCDEAPYDVNPDKFLNIIRGAKYVCTDSFHGAAFSIIMEKQFVVFDRYPGHSIVSKNSRIESLCNNLSLENRRATGSNNINNIMMAEIDYLKVKSILSNYIDSTKKYLKTALSNY